MLCKVEAGLIQQKALWQVLGEDLSEIKIGIGVDAAAADFKCRPLFKTTWYVGIDMLEKSLTRGRKRHPCDFAVVGDISNIQLRPDSLSVCVSTNTLYMLDRDQKIAAVEHMTDWVKGTLILELPTDDAADVLWRLKERFRNVQTLYFGNRLSRFFVWLFTRNGGLSSISNRWPFSIVNRWLTSIELSNCRDWRDWPIRQNDNWYLTPHKKAVYIVCCDKIINPA